MQNLNFRGAPESERTRFVLIDSLHLLYGVGGRVNLFISASEAENAPFVNEGVFFLVEEVAFLIRNQVDKLWSKDQSELEWRKNLN